MTQTKRPRGLRNNNPLNIRRTKGASWIGLSSVQSDAQFCQFVNMEYGFRAAFMLLKKYYYNHHLVTIRQWIDRWAPPTENETSKYADMVGKIVNYPVDRMIPPLREAPHLWLQIVLAMAIVENGMDTIHLDEALSAMKGMGYVINMGTKEKS